MSNPGPDSLPVSALQHWLFCPRQCALIHVERLWAENWLTASGRILHERADAGGASRRDGVRTLRSVSIASARHGLHGLADVVEMRGQPPRPYPVEYKRGRPKSHHADEVQLCAQALCLEEMCACDIPEGALFYGQKRRRQTVLFDEGLRALTLETARQARQALARGALPAPAYDPRRCKACSLFSLCRPKDRRAVGPWLRRAVQAEAVPE